MREWVEANVIPNIESWEADGKVPHSIYHQSAKYGLLVPVAAGLRIPEEWRDYPIIGGIKPEEWDGYHDFVLWDELLRGGLISSIFIGLTVGAPPLRLYASNYLQARILPEILSGQSRICLVVSEPATGSDVRNITTTAEKTRDGKHYIVNGEKKWITNGIFSHYFLTAVRTGGPGAQGVWFLLIPRHSEVINCRKIEIGGSPLSATTYITFEDVEVDALYLVGKEGAGFRLIMNKFNHERIWIAFMGLRGARVCLEDTWAWR